MLETAHRYLRDFDALPADERFDAIVWVSAKNAVLTADGIAPRTSIFRAVDDVYNAIAVALDYEAITRARPEDQDAIVRRALTQQRTLLVVDNLETVDDERVLTFLRELPPPTKAIVTTRHRIDVAYPIRLTGMPEEDALALVAHEAEKKGVTLREEQAQRLFTHTGGIPLALVWSIAQMGYGFGVESVLRKLGEPTGDVTRFIFEEAVARIRNTPAYTLLLALSLFATDASREALGFVADLPVLDRDEGLVMLEKLSLVNREGGRFSMMAMTKIYAQDKLRKDLPASGIYFNRMLLFYQDKLKSVSENRIGSPYWESLTNYSQAENLRQEWPNISHLIHIALDEGYDIEALSLFLSMIYFLYTWGLWDERLQLSEEMCKVANRLGDASEAWLWIDGIGHILRVRQQYTEYKQTLEYGRRVASQHNLTQALLLAELGAISLYIDSNNGALQKSEEILQKINLTFVLESGTQVQRVVARRIVDTVAWIKKQQGDFEGAERLYKSELELRRLIGENPAPSLSYLAYACTKLNKFELAEEYLRQAKKTAGKKDEALIHYCWAMIAREKHEYQKAYASCNEALQLFRTLEHQSGLDECQELLDEIKPQL